MANSFTRATDVVESDGTLPMDEFVSMQQNIIIAKRASVSFFMLFVYEWLITLDEEVSLVWPSRFGLPKILFLLNRYLPFCDLVISLYPFFGSDPSLCVEIFRALAGTTLVGFVITQVILAMRIWAIWDRKTSITVLLSVLILGVVGADIYILIHYMGGISYAPLGAFEGVFEGCPFNFTNRLAAIDLALIVVTESVMVILLFIKAFEHFKYSHSALMVRLLKDGVIYFTVILITSIANVVVVLVTPLALHSFLLVPQRTLHSILCSRVLLRIRGAFMNTGLQDSTSETGDYYSFRDTRRVDVAYSRSVNFGRRERHTRNTFELASIEVHSKGDSGAAVVGWGMGQGFDRATPTSYRPKSNPNQDMEREGNRTRSPIQVISTTVSVMSEEPWADQLPIPKSSVTEL